GLCHLSLERCAPAAPAPGLVTGDQTIANLDHVRLVDHVRLTVLLPGEHELDERAVGQRGTADLLEAARVGKPATQLSLDAGRAADAETPVRHCRIENRILGEHAR